MEKKYLTMNEAAEYLRITRQTLGKLVKNGKIKFRQVGRKKLFNIDEL